MKKALRIIVLCLVAAALAALMGWSFVSGAAADGDITCKEVKVHLKGSGECFASPEDITEAIRNRFGDQIGEYLDDIDIVAIEEFVDKRSAVLKSEVYVTRDSILNIDVTQRRPVLRFIRGGVGCYCDDRGNIFPLQGKTTAHVPIVDGLPPVDPQRYGKPEDARARRWVGRMVVLAAYIDGSSWKHRITQMRVNDKGDLVIYLKDCKEKFIFGTPDDIEAKFGRIETYFTHVKPNTEKKYTTVNVKFDRQIVCR
ncbi:MAG: hypothetical protein MJZ07_05790 [Bacteroidales bacterium]|nr:hypothetical protein [Bacteroidales bacterium]